MRYIRYSHLWEKFHCMYLLNVFFSSSMQIFKYWNQIVIFKYVNRRIIKVKYSITKYFEYFERLDIILIWFANDSRCSRNYDAICKIKWRLRCDLRYTIFTKHIRSNFEIYTGLFKLSQAESTARMNSRVMVMISRVYADKRWSHSIWRLKQYSYYVDWLWFDVWFSLSRDLHVRGAVQPRSVVFSEHHSAVLKYKEENAPTSIRHASKFLTVTRNKRRVIRAI